MAYIVIAHGFEDHELIGAFESEEEAIQCATNHESDGTLDNIFLHAITVYKADKETISQVYQYYIED